MEKTFTQEQEMEDTLINQLIAGDSQWNYRPDLNNEEKLWENFFYQLENRNKAKLNDIPLTFGEKENIKSQLNFSSFYNAAKFFRGENGVAQVSLQREDATLGTLNLIVINIKETFGFTTYEVINQYQSKKTTFEDQNSRFDVTLLVNGLPVIQIELKNRRRPLIDAFNQIQKYSRNGKFNGIFSTLQMFVISNGVDTKYIAAADSADLNPKFLTGWVDGNNHPVRNYIDFADGVLNIPAAHHMVFQYSVLDNQRESIILLRPYQVHAVKAVREASYKRESGYIWHTTGSGKTLTSYKVANNLLSIPSIEKTIFIVDRIDLDQQTTSSFASYAEDDYVNISSTDNVSDLINKLASDERTVIVTTIQKLNYILKRYNQNPDNKKLNRVKGLKVAFVVDEAHRAVTPQKQKELKTFFYKSMWYGFTGTPLFAENARDEFGDLARTTEEQYGSLLHQYTVKEAIHDEAVLGFQIEYRKTFDDYNRDLNLQKYNPEIDLYSMTEIEKENKLPSEIYEEQEHKEKVIDSIINKSQNKLGLNNGVGKTYDAILTTSSIEDAIEYYQLFKEIKDNKNPNIEIRKGVKQSVNDFPKVAITYSVSDNEEYSIKHQESMKESLRDYNEMFNTNFTLETIGTYNRDLNNRLARKKDQYLSRTEQLDLVIVVDRLLTGFDAPCLSTLFIDRAPMKPHHLIQAFSRTNRLLDKHKKFGQIVTFQTPNIYKEAVNDALILYSNGGENEIQAPSWEESLKEFHESVNSLLKIAPTPESLIETNGIEEMKKAAKAYQKFDKSLATLQVYTDYEPEIFEEKYGFNQQTLEDYSGHYQNLIERIKDESQETDTDIDQLDLDIEYELETLTTQQIDYDYIIMLVNHYNNKNAGKVVSKDIKDDTEAIEIEHLIESFRDRNPQLTDILLEEFHRSRNHLKDMDVTNFEQKIQQRLNNKVENKIEDFTSKWYLDKDDTRFYVQNYNVSKNGKKQIGETEIMNSADFKTYKNEAEEPLNKLKYKRTVRNELKDFVEDEVLPYINNNS